MEPVEEHVTDPVPDGGRCEFEAGVVTLYTSDSDTLVRRLVESGSDFSELEVLPASLEEAFVSLTSDDR